jgi:hypothetical protein
MVGTRKGVVYFADNYVVALHEPNPAAARASVAAGLAVDTVYKEDKGGGGLDLGE